MQSIGKQFLGLDFSLVDGIVVQLPGIHNVNLVLLADFENCIANPLGLLWRAVVSKLVRKIHCATSGQPGGRVYGRRCDKDDLRGWLSVLEEVHDRIQVLGKHVDRNLRGITEGQRRTIILGAPLTC